MAFDRFPSPMLAALSIERKGHVHHILSRSSSMEGAATKPAKPALITPSASPPSTARSFVQQPYRIPDRPSPTKRPRFSSTSNTLRAPSSSSSASVDSFDFQQAREDSTLRLLNIWSSLERYTRPIDEDDIVDITTGEVIKDRGVLRGSKQLSFGDAMGEEEEGYDEDEEEESTDELDAFANEGVDDIRLNVGIRKVPPVREMDPEDAKDIKEFLEAERKRRETCGSERDESEVEKTPSRSKTQRKKQQSPLERHATRREDAEDPTPHRPTAAALHSESDDELCNWDMDEASMIYLVPLRSSPPKRSPRPTVRDRPPRSRTAPSEDRFFDPPPESTATSPPRISSPLPSPTQHSSPRLIPKSPSLRNRAQFEQRPRPAASPHLDLAKISKRKVRPSKSKAEPRGSDTQPPPVPAPISPPRRPKQSAVSHESNTSGINPTKRETGTPIRKVEVVIEKPPSTRRVSKSEAQEDTRPRMEPGEIKRRASIEAKGIDRKIKGKKGQEKELILNKRDFKSIRDGDVVVPCSSSLGDRRPRESPPPSNASSSSSLPDPHDKHKTRGRPLAPGLLSSPKKRKRIASAADPSRLNDRDTTPLDEEEDRTQPDIVLDDKSHSPPGLPKPQSIKCAFPHLQNVFKTFTHSQRLASRKNGENPSRDSNPSLPTNAPVPLLTITATSFHFQMTDRKSCVIPVARLHISALRRLDIIYTPHRILHCHHRHQTTLTVIPTNSNHHLHIYQVPIRVHSTSSLKPCTSSLH